MIKTGSTHTMSVASSAQGTLTIEHIAQELARCGAVLLSGIEDSGHLLELARNLGPVIPHRDSDARGLTRIAPRDNCHDAGYQGFSSKGLSLHTDRAGEPGPPALMMLLCEKPAKMGGESILCDGKLVFDALRFSKRESLKRLCTHGTAVFGDRRSPYEGAVFESADNNLVRIRFRFDEMAFFSSRILGDLAYLLEALDSNTISLKLNAGEGMIIDNHRWLHGRTPYLGGRAMYRLLVGINPSTRQKYELHTGFRSSCE